LLVTLALVVMVIFLFLKNLSATVIPSLALPFSDHRHIHGDVPDGVQPRQPLADGADIVGGIRS